MPKKPRNGAPSSCHPRASGDPENDKSNRLDSRFRGNDKQKGGKLKPLGIGIDLLSLKRAGAFVRKHSPAQISRLLSESEKQFWKCRRLDAAAFARILTAKEAFFKALNASWMGLDGFSKIELKCFHDQRFHVESRAFGNVSGCGSFFQAGNWVGAQIILDQRQKTKD